jgi:hypothetical protein
MSKPRSDSLWARLSAEQRQELLVELVEEGISLAAAKEKCGTWGVETSAGSLSAFLSQHGLPWRLERARASAEASKDSLPTDWEAAKARGFASRQFELAFSELSAKELACLRGLELEERRLALAERDLVLKEQTFRRKTCELFLEWNEDEKARAIAQSGASQSEKIEALGQAMFGEDWEGSSTLSTATREGNEK